jgi:hypothetical protein
MKNIFFRIAISAISIATVSSAFLPLSGQAAKPYTFGAGALNREQRASLQSTRDLFSWYENLASLAFFDKKACLSEAVAFGKESRLPQDQQSTLEGYIIGNVAEELWKFVLTLPGDVLDKQEINEKIKTLTEKAVLWKYENLNNNKTSYILLYNLRGKLAERFANSSIINYDNSPTRTIKAIANAIPQLDALLKYGFARDEVINKLNSLIGELEAASDGSQNVTSGIRTLTEVRESLRGGSSKD